MKTALMCALLASGCGNAALNTPGSAHIQALSHEIVDILGAYGFSRWDVQRYSKYQLP